MLFGWLYLIVFEIRLIRICLSRWWLDIVVSVFLEILMFMVSECLLVSGWYSVIVCLIFLVTSIVVRFSLFVVERLRRFLISVSR